MKDTLQGYGPTNPRPWDPNHPSLKAPAPHEVRATMRMHRAGWPSPEIVKALKVRPAGLVNSLRAGLDEEGQAHRERRPIYDSTVSKGTV